MPTDNFDYQNFYETTLSSDITNSALTIPLTTVPSPSEGLLVINPDGASPEIIYYTSKGVNDVTCPANGRGFDGSNAQPWTDGTTVIMAPVGYMFRMIRNGLVVVNNPPQGYMINGRIDASVSSNNLTVSIKTLAGSDPSTSDPVFVRIGNTVRTITSALSVTKNAGTNWFNSGATGLATTTLDYWASLGYNATDGVVLAFHRKPSARKYGDWSTTDNDHDYAAISTITNAASTDEYEVIGAFQAKLSGSGTYNWSLPASPVVISRPIYEPIMPVYSSAYLSASQTGLADLGTVKVLFDSEHHDNTGHFASNRFTAPVSGWYSIHAYYRLGASASNIVAATGFIYKNGSNVRALGGDYPKNGAGEQVNYACATTSTMYLEAGDYIEGYATADVISGTWTVGGGVSSSRLECALLRPA